MKDSSPDYRRVLHCDRYWFNASVHALHAAIVTAIRPRFTIMTDTTYEEAPAATQPEAICQKVGTKPAHICNTPELPYYMREVYDWAYVSPAWVQNLDHNLVVKTLLFGNDRRLMQKYLGRIQPGMRVWQVAHVYGDLVSQAASRTGSSGCFHLTDVTPIQLEHARAKLQNKPWTKTFLHDAAHFSSTTPHTYDLACSFMLLHEVPDDWKRKIVDNMLDQISENGEAFFVDYHRPAYWQPVRYILKLVNRFLEPFADALWRNEISSFCSHPEDFIWQKETIFAGVYQTVSVKRKQAD
jgi:SAM-dependent methyltransferase